MYTSNRRQMGPTAVCAVILALALTLLPLADYCAACARVRTEVLRLHVLANSDSAEDQAVKLLVRDALLMNTANLMRGCATAQEAAERLKPCLETMGNRADAVLRQNGFAYTATAQIVDEYFDARAYGDVTLPAGSYTALKIVLGQGEGKNWWCVLFPPLCLPAAAEDAAAVVFAEEQRVVAPAEGYAVRFKLAEVLARFFEKKETRRAEPPAQTKAARGSLRQNAVK